MTSTAAVPVAVRRVGMDRARDIVDLVRVLAARELKVRYRRSSLGWLWSVLHPLLLMLVFHLVFSEVFRFDVPSYPVYALAGLLCWNFVQQGIVSSMHCLRVQSAFVTKLPVARMVFPAAVVMAGAANLLLALAPLVVLMFVTGRPPTAAFPLLAAGLIIATAFTLGIAMLLAPLAVMYSDVMEIVSVGLTLVMYLTPVFYPMEIVPPHLRWALLANPMTWILRVFRDPIYAGQAPPIEALAIAGAWAAVSLLAGIAWFRHTDARIPFEI